MFLSQHCCICLKPVQGFPSLPAEDGKGCVVDSVAEMVPPLFGIPFMMSWYLVLGLTRKIAVCDA